MYLNLSLPLQPILSRWGTWLEETIYYGKYFNELGPLTHNQNEAKVY